MSVKLGMNGFGRIGRYLLRLLADSEDIVISAINARADNAQLAHLFKYDSVHGTFQGSVGYDDNGIIVNGRHIVVTRRKTGEWEWGQLGVDIAVETTGTLKDRDALAWHLDRGAKKVVISAPCKTADVSVVMGVNTDAYDGSAHKIISAASCTTNCLAPVVKVLQDSFGIRHGLMTTIHSYTMSQRILDGSHKDLRRARAGGVSMIPTSTGAAKTIGLILPELAGRMEKPYGVGKRISLIPAPSWNRWKRFRGGVRPSSTSTLARPRSASTRTTRLPFLASSSARLTDRLVLPTPPLPEVTEKTRGKVSLMPGAPCS